jgi:L-alanine-DL-glutamate epimerase-like enolase superfamily enzyme
MSTKIRELIAEPLDLPLWEPFRIATGIKDAAWNVLIRVVLEDGTIGFGEVSPSPYTTGDTRETVLAVLDQLRPAVIGKDVRSWRGLLTETRNLVRNQVAAHSGLEIAVLDAFGKSQGIPLAEMFGGVKKSVETDMTLSLGTPEKAGEDAAKFVKQGFNKLKIKVGLDVLTDSDRIVAVRDNAPDSEISLDANQAFSPKEAIELIRLANGRGANVSMFEQPVRKDDFEGMKFVRDHCPLPIAADETVFTPEDALRVVRDGAADMINIKIAKCGILGALEIISICRTANIGLMIGAMMESKIGLAASVHLSCGFGTFIHNDLDSVYLLKPFECEGGFELDGPNFSVEGITSGTGIVFEPKKA